MKKGITTKINAHDITWRTVLEACEHFLFQLLRQGHDIQLLDLQARGDDSPVVKNHWADWWVEACTVGPFQVFQSFSLFSRSFTQISQFAIVPHSLYPQGDKPRVFWAFFFQNWVAIPEKIIPCQQIIKILESLSLPKYYLVVCTIMVACRKNGGYQTSGFWFWFWQCGYICQKTRLPSGGFEMTMMARCFMFLLRPVEISSNPVTNHGAPGFTKLDGFWHVFHAFFCHAQAITAIGWLDDWDWVQRTLRSLGSPGQCDLRQRRRLSVPSLRAKAAETWLGHGYSEVHGASKFAWDFHLNCSRWPIPFFFLRSVQLIHVDPLLGKSLVFHGEWPWIHYINPHVGWAKHGRRWRRLQLNLGCNSVLKHRLTELEEMLQVGFWMVAMGRFPHGITSQKWWI